MNIQRQGVAAAPALSLRRNLLHAGVGKIIFALSQFGILAVVARLGTPEQVGAMTLASAVVTPLFFLTSMGMRDVHAVDDLDRFTRADYVALRLIGALAALVVIGLLAMTYQASSGWLVQATTLAFALVKFFGAQSSLNHGMFQRAERMDFVARSILVRALSGFLVFAATFWISRDLPLALLMEGGAWYGTYLLVDRRLLVRLGARTLFRELVAVRLRNVGALAWWIMPVGISLWLTRAAMSVPPLVLERHTDLATVGVFGATAYLYTSIAMVSGTLGSASAARLRRHFRTGQRTQFVRLALRLTLLSSALGCTAVLLAWAAGDEILGILFGDVYRRADLLVIVMLASAIAVTAAPLLTALNAGQAFRLRVASGGMTLVASLAVSFVLVPAFGAVGAAWSLVIATAANLILTAACFHIVSARLPARAPAPAADTGAPESTPE